MLERSQWIGQPWLASSIFLYGQLAGNCTNSSANFVLNSAAPMNPSTYPTSSCTSTVFFPRVTVLSPLTLMFGGGRRAAPSTGG